jgi:hypothetical protein
MQDLAYFGSLLVYLVADFWRPRPGGEPVVDGRAIGAAS